LCSPDPDEEWCCHASAFRTASRHWRRKPLSRGPANSDTTYRIFDWNRVDEQGEQRQLHVDQALQCIDFNDVAPEPITPSGELLVRHELFEVQKWRLNFARDIAVLGQFAIVLCLTGALQCAGVDFTPGDFFLVPASLQDRSMHPRGEGTSLLRITIPM